jgi:hypothetical protein
LYFVIGLRTGVASVPAAQLAKPRTSARAAGKKAVGKEAVLVDDSLDGL